MNEAEFRARAIASGFADFQHKEYSSDTDVPMHAHAFSVTLLVMDGEFSLQYADSKSTFLPGECCDLPATVLHAERAGPSGARVLLAKKI